MTIFCRVGMQDLSCQRDRSVFVELCRHRKQECQTRSPWSKRSQITNYKNYKKKMFSLLN